jgi:hypothetical protein
MDLGPQIVRNSYQYLLVQSGANPIRLGNNGSVNWSAGGVVASTGNQIISGTKTFANGATVSGGFNVVGGGTNYFGSGFSTNHFGSGAAINYFGSEAAGNIIGSQFSANSLNGNWQLNGNLNITGSVSAPNLVYNIGNQNISGVKTFTTGISAPNVVYNTGDQIISGTKTFASTISASINGNAGTVTNGVYTVGNQTIGGTKTFSSVINGSITGSAGSVPVSGLIGSSEFVSSFLQTPDKSSAQELLETNLSQDGVTVSYTGTLSGPIGPIVYTPPASVSINEQNIRTSGSVGSVVLGTHPNASFIVNGLTGLTRLSNVGTIDFPDLELIITPDSSANVMLSSTRTGPYSLPKLKFSQNILFSFQTFLVSSISLTELIYAPLGVFQGTTLTNCTTISLPKLIIGGITFGSVPMLENITLPSIGVWKESTSTLIIIAGAKLNQSTVDNLLGHLAYMDGNNGTRLFGSGATLNISGGTSAAPSNLGSTTTLGSNFVCSGTTCTVNMTNHGYTTGTVLRISGVTTATNANRYAVITVLNANQFTYTITSQNATGAGTATVIRAGASASALVTRGVTLTTN